MARTKANGLNRGFTLVELLVVISITAILAAMLLPALTKARETAKLIKCATQQRSIAMFSFIYANDNQDRLPERGTAYSFPFYGWDIAGLRDNETNFMLGNYILQGDRLGAINSIEDRISFTAFLWDYCELKNNSMWASKSGTKDVYMGFLNPNTVFHCPSLRLTVPLDYSNNPGANPNPFISYALIGYGTSTNGGDAYNLAVPIGFPRVQRIESIPIAGSGVARVGLLVDLMNHTDSGNVANPDGSVHRFSYSTAYVATSADGVGRFYLPAEYTYLKWSAFTNYNYTNSCFGDPFNGDISISEAGSQAIARMAQFGYTSPSR